MSSDYVTTDNRGMVSRIRTIVTDVLFEFIRWHISRVFNRAGIWFERRGFYYIAHWLWGVGKWIEPLEIILRKARARHVE